ncbi:MAG: hypothetical protein JXQ72_13645 [Anaerolineae bacterium]|nr:hypothetical protein [Anaerolineae bacterium]
MIVTLLVLVFVAYCVMQTVRADRQPPARPHSPRDPRYDRFLARAAERDPQQDVALLLCAALAILIGLCYLLVAVPIPL